MTPDAESAPASEPDAESAPAPEPDAESAPASEPAVSPASLIPVSPDPERVSPAGWVYPRIWEDRLAGWGAAALRGGLALCGLLALVVAGVWAVPSLQVANRDSYRVACERARGDTLLTSSLGQDLRCQRVPGFYRLEQEAGDLYEWWVEGSRGRARVRAEVKDGEVQRFRVLQLELGWLE